MPLDSLEFRTSLQKLLIGVILILVPLTVFGFYVALQGDSHIRQMNGENFRALTQASAETALDFIGGCVRDVSVIANSPGPIEAVSVADRQYEHLSEDAISAKINAIEQRAVAPARQGRDACATWLSTRVNKLCLMGGRYGDRFRTSTGNGRPS